MPTLNDLLNGECQEYPAGSPTLSAVDVAERTPLVPNWELVDGDKGLRLSRRMDDFNAAIDLVNKVAEVAEAEQHHPDIRVHGYRNVVLDLSTHSLGGLTDNDFIMAAKIDQVLEG